jgi:hypothetical protein
MLHLALYDLGKFAAGNVYVFGSRKPSWMPSLKSIFESCANCITGNAAQQETNRTTLLSVAHLLGVEISPGCDHAQKKLRQSKILAGFIIPKAQDALIKRNPGAFLKVLGPFHLSAANRIPEGDYSIYLNSLYVQTAEPETVARIRAFARFRSPLLSDVQAWCSYQNARQGVMMLK